MPSDLRIAIRTGVEGGAPLAHCPEANSAKVATRNAGPLLSASDRIHPTGRSCEDALTTLPSLLLPGSARIAIGAPLAAKVTMSQPSIFLKASVGLALKPKAQPNGQFGAPGPSNGGYPAICPG